MEHLQTGDILLFTHYPSYKGIGSVITTLFTYMICYFTDSKYSHAAIVVRDPQFTTPPLKGLYVLESNFESFPDVEDKKLKIGVELVKLEDVVKRHSGDIYWRKLECKRDDEFFCELKDIHSIIHNSSYNFIPQDWIDAAVGNSRNKKRINTFWCSALVAYIYTFWRFLPKSTAWTLITPEQLGTEHNNCLKFSNCKLHPEVLLNCYNE